MAEHRPNILIVMADQLMPFLTGAYGHPVVKTPNLDRLVREGVRFDAAYSPCPLCVPARASMMTGKHASRIRSYDNAAALDSEELTLAHYLAVAGYDTVASGKMHYVGPDQLHGLHRRLTTDVYPEEYDWLFARDPGDPPSKSHARGYTSEGVKVDEWSRYLSYDEEAHFRAKEYLRAQGRARRAASERGEEPRPFFLIASYHHPHDPFWPPKELWDLYEGEPIDIPYYPENMRETYSTMDRELNFYHGVHKFPLLRDPESLRCVRRAYYALVTYIDGKVGELLRVLESSGLQEDTVVLFLSDHGDMLCEKSMVQKRSLYEWSSRVPLILRFPGQQHSGRVIKQPISLIDVLPTVLDIAGIEDYLPVDGTSVMGLIDTDGDANRPERTAYSEFHSNGVYTTCFMIRRDVYKYIYIHGENDQLFNLEADPGEWHNLIGQPEVATIEEELRERILEEFDPDAIELDIRETIRKRQVLKRWVEITGTKWDYFPYFDAGKNALEQYLQEGA